MLAICGAEGGPAGVNGALSSEYGLAPTAFVAVAKAEFALGDDVHRWRDQGPPCLMTACCVDSNTVEVKHGGPLSFGGEHPKYPAAWLYSSRFGHPHVC